MKLPKLPKWLKAQYVTQTLLATSACANAVLVVADHSAWLNAAVVGACIASSLSSGALTYFFRRLRAAEALLHEQQDMIKAMMEIKTSEIGESIAHHFGTQISGGPRVTKH